MQKKFWILAVGILTLSSFSANAETNEKDILKNMLLSEELVTIDEASTAQTEARKILEAAPRKIEAKGIKQQPLRQQKDLTKTFDKYGEAPFGLAWGSNTTYTKSSGVTLKEIVDKDKSRSFSASFLPKPISEFDRTVVYFGAENKLWRIIAYGKAIDDDSSASNVLKEYRKYSRLLEIKYGNKAEVFSPKITQTEKINNLGGGKTETIIETKEEPIGGENFLNEIKNADAFLYSTFNDSKTGVSLTIQVNEEDKSYIIIDYKNLQIIKEEEDKTLEAI